MPLENSPLPLFDESKSQVLGIIRNLEEPNLRVKDLDINYRQANYWEEKNLFYEGYSRSRETSWRKFSLLDYFWIKLVSNLRSWGVSFESLKKLKSELETPIGRVEEKSLLGLFSEEKSIGTLRVFPLLLAEFVVSRLNINLLATQKDRFCLFNPSHQEFLDPEIIDILNHTHISVSIADLFREMLFQKGVDQPSFQIRGLYSKEEMDLYRLIRFGIAEEVSIYPLHQVKKSSNKLPGDSYDKFLKFYADNILGWPYERLEYIESGSNPKTIECLTWEQRLNST